MKTALQSASLTAMYLFAYTGSAFCFFGLVMGDCALALIGMSCISASLLTIILRAMFLR